MRPKHREAVFAGVGTPEFTSANCNNLVVPTHAGVQRRGDVSGEILARQTTGMTQARRHGLGVAQSPKVAQAGNFSVVLVWAERNAPAGNPAVLRLAPCEQHSAGGEPGKNEKSEKTSD